MPAMAGGATATGDQPMAAKLEANFQALDAPPVT
jgi:hypothetical protein